MLNERFDTFSHLIEYGDNEPTKPQLALFQMLRSDLVKQANLPALIITESKKS